MTTYPELLSKIASAILSIDVVIRRKDAQIRQLNGLLDESIDEVVDLKFSLEEATGVPQN